MSIRKLLLLGLLLALILPAQALAGGKTPPGWQKKIDNALRQVVKTNNAAQRVIIRAMPGQEAAVKGLVNGKGKIKADHELIGAFSAVVNSKDLEALASNDAVATISIDAKVGGAQLENTAAAAATSYTLRETLGLNATSPTGSHVGVAVIDSGIAPSAEFGLRITAFFDFTRGGAWTRPYDDYGHGTHVAGLIAGNGSLSGGQYQGVAPGARLIGLKVLDSQGAGYASDIISALEFAIRNKALLGIDVINMSLGHPIYESAATDPLVLAVNQAVAHGIVVVVSAGNIGINKATGQVGYAGITSPGNALGAITVGAAATQDTPARSDDAIADYSSRGPTWLDALAKPDIVAPGHHMVSATTTDCTLYRQYPQIRVTTSTGNQMLRLNGTSMAAGVASGAAAVLIDSYKRTHQYARLTPIQVKAILEFTAIPVVGANVLAQGTGELNVAGAMALATNLDFSAAGGKLLYGVNESTVIGGELGLWANEIIWTRNVVRGGNIIWSDNIVWSQDDGDNIVWGEVEGDGDNIVWGEVDEDNIVWGESDLENIVWGECDLDNIVWGESEGEGDNIVWGEGDLENIVWGENVAWGESLLDNVIWGEMILAEDDLDNIVWGESVLIFGGAR